MIQKQPPKPSPEYIAKLATRLEVWSRKNEEANKYVFEDLDNILESLMIEAYKGCHYEGFAHIERLREYLKVTFPTKLRIELETVKKLEP